MAVCIDCDQEMLTAASCSVDVVHQNRVPFGVIRYGSERHWGRPKGRCHDCGVLPGGAHHLGCDVAECPRCRRQMLMCGCHFDEYGPLDEDEDKEHWPDE